MTLSGRMVAAVAAALAAAGCGGGENEGAADGLEGGWYAEDATAFDCAVGFFFDASGGYEYHTLCSLEGGGWGDEGWTGNYELEGDQLTLRATHSTCTGASPRSDVVRATRDGERLTIVAPGTTFVLVRVPEDDDDASATVRHGCFAEDGSFTPGELVEL